MGNMRAIIVGCGNMGTSHAEAIESIGGEVVALVSRGDSKKALQDKLGRDIPLFSDYQEAIDNVQADAVVGSTFPDTHVAVATYALERNLHVFTEKPIAESVDEAEGLRKLAEDKGCVLTVGYILEYSPGWNKFVEEAKSFAGPYEIVMTLDQRSSGKNWETHQALINGAGSPVVDCSTHYLSQAGQIIRADPVKVLGLGMRFDESLPEGTFDYAEIKVWYDEGSLFTYRSTWGPRTPTEGFSLKKVTARDGFVQLERVNKGIVPPSDFVPAHVNVELIRKGYAELDDNGNFAREDKLFNFKNESEHDDLDARQMQYFFDAIEEKVDPAEHLKRAVDVTRIALAGHQSALEDRIITL